MGRPRVSTRPIGPRGLGGESPPMLLEKLRRQRARQSAEQKINSKWSALGGAPGPAKIPGEDGLIAAGTGFYREYAGGRIYYHLGRGPCFVYGAIGARYIELNAQAGWLGWPTSDEQPFSENGRVTPFENGAIYWWSDIGAIDLNNVAVRYTGLYCFGETDWDQGSDSDEPYVILGVVPPVPGDALTVMTKIYEDVDDHESREDLIELYHGLPLGLALSATVMEKDFGDPNKYRAAVQVGVEKAAEGVKLGVGEIPVVGPFLAPVAAEILKAVGPEIVDAVNDALDTKDDNIGVVNFVVTAKDMVVMTRRALNDLEGIKWHLASPLVEGSGASYKVYLDIIGV